MDPKTSTAPSSQPQYQETRNVNTRSYKRDTFIDVNFPSYELEFPPNLALPDRKSWHDYLSQNESASSSSSSRLSSRYSGFSFKFNSAATDEKEKDEPPASAEGEFPQGFVLWMIVLAVILSFFLVSLDMTIVATAIPKITDEFRTIADVSWYSSAFFMTTAGFQSTWGKAYKYFALKTTFLASIVIFELGSLFCGAAPVSFALIVGRAIQGIGGAGIGSGCYTILGFSVEPKKRPMFTGIVGASYGIASVLGPLLGGVFSDKLTWRWCFYINVPIGAVSVLAIVLFFEAPAAAKPQEAPWKEKLLQMDPLGAILMLGSIISLILALQKGGQTDPWDAPVVLGLLIGAGAATILFVVWEVVQGERAMIVPRLFKKRLIFFPSMFLMFFAGGYYTLIYNLPLYFQSIDGTDPTQSGVRNLPLIIAVSIASILSGSFVSSTGFAAPLMPLGAAVSVIAAGLLSTLDIGTEPVKWIVYQILAGIGFGVAIQMPMIISQSSVHPSDLASITAVMMFFQTIGAAVLVSAAQASFINVLLAELRTSAPSVSPASIISTGATALRQTFGPDQLPGVLAAYMSGLKVTFIIVLGATMIAAILSTYIPWKKLGHDAPNPAAETANEETKKEQIDAV